MQDRRDEFESIMVPTVANLKIDWFHCTKSQKDFWFHCTFLKKMSGSMEPLELPLTPALGPLKTLRVQLCLSKQSSGSMEPLEPPLTPALL